MSGRISSDRGFRVRGLGEVAIRCNDIGGMAAFYEGILGLERLEGNASGDIVFFRLADGFQGHTQVLALFDRRVGARPGEGPPETGPGSSLHHVALTLPFDEQEAAMRWFEAKGLDYRIEQFGWVGWRGVFTQDPEGNTVELVAYSPDMLTG
ncbi:VOC family protein [Rhodobacterales bacterium HKCCSP123]|nr:VOC family protein [Rhodobacterales bacterium HKCCSP123]